MSNPDFQGSVRQIQWPVIHQNSSLLSTPSCNGTVNAAVLVDYGSDITVLVPSLPDLIHASGLQIQDRRLIKPMHSPMHITPPLP